MGWLFVNIVVPSTLPLVMLLAFKLVDLPAPYDARAKLLRAVQDGQLGWVAMCFAASCAYELFDYVFGSKQGAPSWAGFVLSLAIVTLVISAVVSVAGTLFPVDDSKPKPATQREWLSRYRLFISTDIVLLLTACLYCLVHYSLPASRI